MNDRHRAVKRAEMRFNRKRMSDLEFAFYKAGISADEFSRLINKMIEKLNPVVRQVLARINEGGSDEEQDHRDD